MLDTDIKRKDIPKTNRELNDLFTNVVNKIKFINDNYDKIESSKHLEKLQEAYEEIYGTIDEDWNIIKKGKLDELKDAYNEILEDNSENEKYSLKSQIESLLEEIELDKKKISNFILNIEWEYWKNEFWEKIKIKNWFIDRINSQIKKFDILYNEIDERLKDWSTSVELAWIYAKKVLEYNKLENKWSNLFIFIILFVLWYYSISTIWNESIKTLTNLFNFLLLRLPFFAMAIWLLIFIWNRRAEVKKLEESYKHKEVMAWAYVWYKKSISELNSDDNKLLENHMKNLLDAMSIDSSQFLNSKWENHPFMEVFNKFLNKDNFPEWELEIPGWKITFKK